LSTSYRHSLGASNFKLENHGSIFYFDPKFRRCSCVFSLSKTEQEEKGQSSYIPDIGDTDPQQHLRCFHQLCYLQKSRFASC
jgi:hypothetical protein